MEAPFPQHDDVVARFWNAYFECRAKYTREVCACRNWLRPFLPRLISVWCLVMALCACSRTNGCLHGVDRFRMAISPIKNLTSLS